MMIDQIVFQKIENLLHAAAALRFGGQEPTEHTQSVIREAAPL